MKSPDPSPGRSDGLFPGPFADPLPALVADASAEDGTGPARRTVRCRLCGRPLTGTASRRTGLGPACDAKLHPAGPDIPTRRRDADQDTLPGT